MITIGFSTREHNQAFIDYIQKTCMYKEVQIIEKINNGSKSLSKVYNEILDEAQYDIVVLCHDDIEFETNRWGDKILKHFSKNPEFGILGLAGSKFLSTNAQWWVVPNTMYGIVNHKHEGKKWTSQYSNNLGNNIEETILVDGLFIALNKQKIKHNFDETIKGFHFYDLGLCIPNFLSDIKIGVIFDVRVTHLSIGKTNQSWENNRIDFSEKYSKFLPLDINNKKICETFIFIHDQDLLLSFEDNNKFKNLYSYKYVFLGNKDTSKIESLPNVIIAKNYEDNIEQYPLFSSYTGWYVLWKNNLISTDYINLIEYDTILDPYFSQIQQKFFESNSEIIGYIPFPMNHYQFIQNPEWNEYIIPAIKNVYKTDITNTYKRILINNPNALWSSTSNTTFKKDIFNEYMKWFLPLVDYIKDTKTCGHAHERSITFFSTLKNKKVLLTKGLMKHLQMNSHKTQGHTVDFENSLNKLLNIN